MSINLFLEPLLSSVPGQVLKSGCLILSIMEDLLLVLHLIPWTLCAFFHKMKIIGLPSVEVCISLNALYSTSALIFKSYFVCRESLRQRKKNKSILLSDVSKMAEQKALDSSFTQHPNSTMTRWQKSLCETSRNWFKALCNLVCVCTHLLM